MNTKNFFALILILACCLYSTEVIASSCAQIEIVNSYGNPRSGVQVSLTDKHGSFIYEGQTGNAGVVQFTSNRVPSGHYTAWVGNSANTRSGYSIEISYKTEGWTFYKITY